MFDAIFLTGFKKFGNHAVNPTEEVVKAIEGRGIAGVRCSIVEVTAADADKYVEAVRSELAQRKGEKILHLHFGVGPNKVYHLETAAYNNKDFRIPDNAGYQPRNEKIAADMDLESPLKTQLNLEEMKQLAVKAGHESILSTDPGRYLCNYIYFRSLEALSRKHENNESLFIHFPTHAISPH